MQAFTVEKLRRVSFQEHINNLEQQISCLSGMGAQNDSLRNVRNLPICASKIIALVCSFDGKFAEWILNADIWQ